MWFLGKIESYLIEQQILQPMPAYDHLPLFGQQVQGEGFSHFLGPTWMDDTAICVKQPASEELPGVMGQVAGFLLELCNYHCLSPNLSPGKTELLLCFRGRGSRKMKLQFYGPQASLAIPILCENETRHLRLITQYKHLGGLCHHAGDQRAELKQRLAIAHCAFGHHRRLLFHNVSIPWAKRVEYFQMLMMTKLLYGAESWIAIDQKTQDCFHTGVLKLYRRLLRVKADCHLTDDDILVQVALPSPSELLRRGRLRYYATLVKANIPQLWDLLACDDYWCRLIEEDMCWMWDQLKFSSELQDPRTHFAQWSLLIQTRPGFWKRLIRRASEHCCLQRQKRHHAQSLHAQAIIILQSLLPTELFAVRPDATYVRSAFFGCMQCRLRCRSRAGEEAHAFKCHRKVSHLRTLCDHPTCPSCLKFFHTMKKLKAHLYYNERCRTTLQGRNLQCVVEPGSGSGPDFLRESCHDRLLPPIQCQGPSAAPSRRRHQEDIDGDLYDVLVDLVVQSTDVSDFQTQILEAVRDRAISWTRLRRTLDFFVDTLVPEDAEVLSIDLAAIKETITHIGCPDTWPFLADLHMAPDHAVPKLDYDRLCHELRQFLQKHEPCLVPRPFGKHRVVLHLFSGRRRRGDVQFYLDSFSSQQEALVLHVISIDIIIDRTFGDVTRQSTRDYWLGAIRQGWVIGMLAGPPCETWSRARGVPIQPLAQHADRPHHCGPRILRDAQSRTLRVFSY